MKAFNFTKVTSVYSGKVHRCMPNIILNVDTKESNYERLHDQALRFAQKCKDENLKFDIEVCGLLHTFISACGVTQEEMDKIYGGE